MHEMAKIWNETDKEREKVSKNRGEKNVREKNVPTRYFH